MRYRQVHVISGKGSGPAQFADALRGIAIGRADRVYAVGDSVLKVLEPKGSLCRQWRTAKPGFSVGVAAGEDEKVYVGQEGQVQRFGATGRLLATWRDRSRLGLVTAVGAFGDQVLLGDVTHRCIHRYDKNGKLINDIGTKPGRRGFLIPNGHLDFFVDAKGVVHAANPGKHRIERYTLDGELLGHIGKFGGPDPTGFSGCCNPTNVALTPRGHIVVTVKAPPGVKLYTVEGKLLALIDGEGFDPNCKNMDVAVDSRGRIYVIDTVRLQICVFAPADTAEPKQAAEGAVRR